MRNPATSDNSKLPGGHPLDCSDRIHNIRDRIKSKDFLYRWYVERYGRFIRCINTAPQGRVIEIGSGGGFFKEVYPRVTTTDVIPYEGLDLVVDAREMPFSDGSVAAMVMMNVLHHISEPEKFFKEVERCLVPGGKIYLTEPYISYLSYPIYRFIHHEPIDIKAQSWSFPSKGPLSDANEAIPWIVFERDYAIFQQLFPSLKVSRKEHHSPLRYWLSGGLTNFSGMPGSLFPVASWVDSFMARVSKQSCCFFDVEITKML